MSDVAERQGARGAWVKVLLVLLLTALAAGGGVGVYVYRQRVQPPPLPPSETGEEVSEARLTEFCGACHRVPPPSSFPYRAWPEEVEQGYKFFNEGGIPVAAPPIDPVIRYYQKRAPKELPPAQFENAAGPPPVRFEKVPVPALPDTLPTHTSNVNLVHLFSKDRLDILACEMGRADATDRVPDKSRVLVLSPYEKSPKWKVLANENVVHNPAHAEVVDLNGDGIPDILVANLGSFTPTDTRFGSVVWLRGNRDGTFTPFTLLENVGRVADVEAADFRGTGKLDLVVAEFGWHKTGSIKFLRNETTDWNHPKFVPQVLDKRHGTIHVPVLDLNGDGKPDFVALISQEYETVVAFFNEGNGKFRKETLWAAPHPAWGSSGIQMVDLNGDGHPDVLYTNGDVLDQPYLLKPYHSVQWLENPGNGTYPWAHHPITPMYGVHRAVAADFTGTGRRDVVAVAFLPLEGFPDRQKDRADAVIYLEQTAPGKFVRYSLEAGSCDHVTCVAGDVYGTGRTDLVVGNFSEDPSLPTLTIWKNLGPQPKK
jgi:hypothetical protein